MRHETRRGSGDNPQSLIRPKISLFRSISFPDAADCFPVTLRREFDRQPTDITSDFSMKSAQVGTKSARFPVNSL
jgi:hypothetical protein